MIPLPTMAAESAGKLVKFTSGAAREAVDAVEPARSALSINWELLWENLPDLLRGSALTLAITAGAVCIGVLLGLTIAVCRVSRRWWLRAPATVYVEMFRGTPMLVQILIVYFVALPALDIDGDAMMNWIDTTAFGVWLKGGTLYACLESVVSTGVIAGVMALGGNSGAYLGEIFRGGILAVDRGQREAALSLGMKEGQVFRYVVLPQAFVNALPAVANEFVTLIKDSSLVTVIAVLELTHRADLIAARTYERFTMYFGIAVLYFAMTFITSRGLAWLEKRLRVP